ncbi:MAG: glycoside hydrolase family 2 protein, partial [Marinilabiliales bacterium]
NEGRNSRWYSGSGIYRNVKLIRTNQLHAGLWGTFITTPEVSRERAVVHIETEVINSGLQQEEFIVRVDILNSGGEIVASAEKRGVAEPVGQVVVNKEADVVFPRLWCTQDPALYKAVISIEKEGKVADRTETTFGIRSIEFSPEKGFLLNGESTLLKGGCMHHDNGPLGAAAFDRAEYRRVEIMKNNGFNAIRTAHNPPSSAFLDACDRLGMLVINEAFDHWQVPKNEMDYHRFFDEWWEKDLASMVLRDRNHPSVIIWSIGNEIKERADSNGLAIARMLRDKVREMDMTRPVTQGVSEFWETPGRPWEDTAPVFAQLDVHGYNYMWSEYETDHEKYPERIMIGTESLPSEALENWQMAEKHPYVLGDFVWTGMDYFGESGIGSHWLDDDDRPFLPPWPWFNANCGDISVLGYKKPQMYFRDVVWRNSPLEMMVHAPVPEGRTLIVSKWGWPDEHKSWNWEGHEGTPLQVSVYTRCEQVRLELNGQVLGVKDVSEETSLTARFEVPWEPGELVAIGMDEGREVAREVLRTTGLPHGLRIRPERDAVKAAPGELVWFNIEVIDKEGLPVPAAEIPVELIITGPAELQAVGNGNPSGMKSFRQPLVKTYGGRCQLIVRPGMEPGEITVLAKSPGIVSGTAKVAIL